MLTVTRLFEYIRSFCRVFYFFDFFAVRRRQNEGNLARNSRDHENLAFVLVLHSNALESNKEIKCSHSMFVDLFS